MLSLNIFVLLVMYVLNTFQASLKKKMIQEGLLDKYGNPNEKTPTGWMSKVKKEEYVYFYAISLSPFFIQIYKNCI